MIKILIAGIWAALMALGANYAVGKYRIAHPPGKVEEAPAPPARIEQKKTPSLNIPVVRDGGVQGYVIVQFAYLYDAEAAKALPLPPETYLIDEAFRAIYADDKLDFKRLEVYDLNRLTAYLVERLKVRLNSPLVKDVLVQEFNYVSKSDLHQ